MKAATLLLPLLALAWTAPARAFPAEPDALSSLDDVHAAAPAHPRVEEEAEAAAEAAADVDGSSAKLARDRRSPLPWQPRHQSFQPRFQPQPFPRPGQPQPQPQREGSVWGNVRREPGVGTVVHAEGQGTVWRSRDGNGRVDAHGQWSKVVSGPGKSKPSYNVGVRYEHRF